LHLKVVSGPNETMANDLIEAESGLELVTQ
jgi:hypothetical protein